MAEPRALVPPERRHALLPCRSLQRGERGRGEPGGAAFRAAGAARAGAAAAGGICGGFHVAAGGYSVPAVADAAVATPGKKALSAKTRRREGRRKADETFSALGGVDGYAAKLEADGRGSGPARNWRASESATEAKWVGKSEKP